MPESIEAKRARLKAMRKKFGLGEFRAGASSPRSKRSTQSLRGASKSRRSSSVFARPFLGSSPDLSSMRSENYMKVLDERGNLKRYYGDLITFIAGTSAE